MRRRTLIVALAGGALAPMAFSAKAQGWPTRSIQIVVPFAAGGLTDIVARVLAQGLTASLGQSVIVMNMPGGGGGIVGTEYVVRAQPDGYTLYLGANSMATYPHVRPASSPLKFSVEHDLVPIAGVSASAHVFVVHKSVGAKTLAELVELARRKPGELNYASAGVGSTTHLPPALFAHEMGLQMTHVPYRGAAPALQDTLAGRTSLFAIGYSRVIDQPVKDGTLIPLAVTSAQRLAFLPDVPTFVELGYSDMVFPIWLALFAPRGTPNDIIRRLTAECEKLTRDPEFQKALYAQGSPASFIPPDRLSQTLSQDVKRLGERMRATGINFAGES